MASSSPEPGSLHEPRALARYGRRKKNEFRARKPAAAEEHAAFGS